MYFVFVYYESPPPIGGIRSGMPHAPVELSCVVECCEAARAGYCSDCGPPEGWGSLEDEVKGLLGDEVRIEVCSSWLDFLGCGQNSGGNIMILMAPGTEGVALASQVHDECPGNWLVWFSDMDFSRFAFRLGVSWFGLLPASHDKLLRALESCRRFTWKREIQQASEEDVIAL